VPAFADATAVTAAAEAALSAGLHVVVTTSDPALAASLEAIGVEVQAFVSLPDLLPWCALVVTHGGAGTTLAALAYGAPVVAVPQGTPSQVRMASAVERAGVGRCASGPGEVAAAVAVACADEGFRFRARAAQAAERIAAMPSPASVVARLALLAGPG
jgi:UDP:flavonoid glycosyltransferase YjiC (YdhE family)